MGIDYGIVWDIKENYLPLLIDSLSVIDRTDSSGDPNDGSGQE
jgi:uncharacterized protein with HEPN domain